MTYAELTRALKAAGYDLRTIEQQFPAPLTKSFMPLAHNQEYHNSLAPMRLDWVRANFPLVVACLAAGLEV